MRKTLLLILLLSGCLPESTHFIRACSDACGKKDLVVDFKKGTCECKN